VYRQQAVDLICPFGDGLLVTSGKQLLGIEINYEFAGISNNTKLPGSASRMIYSPTLKSLVVAVSVDGRQAILFVENGTSATKMFSLKHMQNSRRSERILSLAQWWFAPPATAILKEELFVAGTSSGNVIILRHQEDGYKHMKFMVKADHFQIFLEKRFSDPIHALLQGWPHRNILFCCVGTILHAMHLDIGERSLVSLAQYQLPSYAVSMTYDGNYLHVLTAKDSIITLLYRGAASFHLHHVDEVERAGLDHMIFALDDETAPGKDSTMILLSDKDCSVVGLHCRHNFNGHIFPREYETLFEAEMPACITKFRLANVRPRWDISRKQKPIPGIIPWREPWEDLLGIGIDGSIRQFTLLKETLWKLLALLQNFAQQIPEICPAAPEIDKPHFIDRSNAFKKHIDGDIIRGWLTFRNLGDFLANNASVSEFALTSPMEDFMDAVMNYWPEMNFGSTKEEKLKTSTDLVYKLLEQLLRPVM
jgi:hypothetical protein